MANNVETFEFRIKLTADEAKASLVNYKGEVIAAGIAVDALNSKLKQTGQATAAQGKAVQLSKKNVEDLRMSAQGASMATGAASASVMEFGRVLSDMPYGIRGVANNLQQLTSNIMFMATAQDSVTGKTVGFVGALKNMGKAMMGPLGIMVAIQGAIALLDHFMNKVDDTTKAIESFSSSHITNATTRLGLLRQALDDSSVSMEDKKEAVRRANLEFKDLNIELDENARLTTEASAQLDHYIDNLMRVAQAKAVASAIEEQLKLLFTMEAQGTRTLEWYEQLSSVFLSTMSGMSIETNQQLQALEKMGDVAKVIDNLKNMLTDKGLIPFLFDGGDRGAGRKQRKRVQKLFQQSFLDLEKEYNAYLQRQANADEKNIFKRLELKQNAEDMALMQSYESFVQGEEDKLQAFIEKEQQKIAAIEDPSQRAAAEAESQKAIEDAKMKVKESSDQALMEYNWAQGELELAQEKEMNALKEKEEQAHMNRLMKQLQRFDQLYNQRQQQFMINEDDRLEMQRQATVDEFNAKAQSLENRMTLAREKGLEIDDLEQEMHNLAIERAMKLTDIEKQETENRIETMGYFGAAAGALSDLLGEQTQAGKIFGIAAATIDTYVAGAKVMTDESIPNTAARVAAMIAVIARGLANVKKIAEVKVPGKSGGAGGAGPTTFNPNFNVVGQSGQNQLAETVAERTNEGTRAYVVYDDIAHAQDIQANAQSASSLG